jgi:hypothetical protein
MTMPKAETLPMLRQLDPLLDEVSYRFVLVNRDIAPQVLGAAIGTFREEEGVTAIIPAQLADEVGQSGADFARITLRVHSDLEAVGLTAAVSAALAEANIACNVVAAFHHDHVFVPWDRRDDAMARLTSLWHAANRS